MTPCKARHLSACTECKMLVGQHYCAKLSMLSKLGTIIPSSSAFKIGYGSQITSLQDLSSKLLVDTSLVAMHTALYSR